MCIHRNTLSCALAVSAFVVFAGPAYAGPFDPAYRDQPNSVHAIFSFQGTGSWTTDTFSTGPAGFPLDPTNPSASDNGVDTTIVLPNFIDELPLKMIRLQLFFNGPVPDDLIRLGVEAFDPQSTDSIIVGGSSGLLSTHFLDIEIRPNPDWERITIFGDSPGNIIPGNLFRIEIDTISIPTPGTTATLGLAALLAIRRRRA
ncbi:MAG: hypothetical protein AAGB34_07030 [Planctomycetota bacterium]